jgi:hypothetical protein
MAISLAKVLLAKRHRAEGLHFLEGDRFRHILPVCTLFASIYLAKLNYTHSNLCVDTFNDAARPYGKTVNGFMLVEGWRIRYLLCLVAASLVCSICIAAIGWVYDQSMEAGLTAGTYAVAVTAVPLGVLTFLSAVL